MAGMAGTALIIALVLSALLYRELHLTYESWRRLHNALFIAVLVTLFVQGWQVAYEKGGPATVAAVATLFIMASALYVYHRFVGPLLRRKTLYRVVSVSRRQRTSGRSHSRHPKTRSIEYLPGQFQFITFMEERRRTSIHHPVQPCRTRAAHGNDQGIR
jgi:predicted ferric reductase